MSNFYTKNCLKQEQQLKHRPFFRAKILLIQTLARYGSSQRIPLNVYQPRDKTPR